MVPYTVYYPERWVIFIKSFEDGEWLTEDFYVSETVYNSISIGDMFEYDENRGDLEEEPYTKEKAEWDYGTKIWSRIYLTFSLEVSLESLF